MIFNRNCVGCLWLDQDHDIVELVIISHSLFFVIDWGALCINPLASLLRVSALLAIDKVRWGPAGRSAGPTTLDDIFEIFLQRISSRGHELLRREEVLTGGASSLHLLCIVLLLPMGVGDLCSVPRLLLIS